MSRKRAVASEAAPAEARHTMEVNELRPEHLYNPTQYTPSAPSSYGILSVPPSVYTPAPLPPDYTLKRPQYKPQDPGRSYKRLKSSKINRYLQQYQQNAEYQGPETAGALPLEPVRSIQAGSTYGKPHIAQNNHRGSRHVLKSLVQEPAHTSRGDHRSQPCLPALPYHQYTVAWISPLPLEQAAARAMLDEQHQTPPRREVNNFDPNLYTLGSIRTDKGVHYVVIAGLARGDIGNHSAAEVAYNLRQTFPKASICLLVGIGGGVPSRKHDLRLGDVVVAEAVLPYERQVITHGDVVRKGSPLQPPRFLLQAVASLEAQHESTGNRLKNILDERQDKIPNHVRPENLVDKLYREKYHHVQLDNAVEDWNPSESADPCRKCTDDEVILRKPRNSSKPEIHHGLIASGDALLRSSSVRETVGREELQVLCFEMEALGVMRALPCLPIRGVSDYADSHKNDEWQRYAAATAAAYARELLEELQPLAQSD